MIPKRSIPVFKKVDHFPKARLQARLHIALTQVELTGTNGSFKNIKLVWLTVFRLVQMAGTGAWHYAGTRACHYEETGIWQIQPFCEAKIQARCSCLFQIRESKTVAACL